MRYPFDEAGSTFSIQLIQLSTFELGDHRISMKARSCTRWQVIWGQHFPPVQVAPLLDASRIYKSLIWYQEGNTWMKWKKKQQPCYEDRRLADNKLVKTQAYSSDKHLVFKEVLSELHGALSVVPGNSQ